MHHHYSRVRYSRFFRLTCRLLKYFLLFLAIFALTCLLLVTLGMSTFAQLLVQGLGPLIFRSAIILAVLMAFAVILESLRL